MTSEAFMVPTPSSSALRALNYAPGIDKLRRTRGKLRSRRLGDLISHMGGSFGAVFTRIDCDPSLGVPLYSQTDTFSAEPAGRIIRRDAMPRPDEQAVQRWQILLAAAGQMAEGNLFGQSIIADARLTNGFCGPDTLALTFADPGGDENLWTYAFLNTSLGLRAVRACAYGTSIPRLRPDLVAHIPVPDAEPATRFRVCSAVRKAVEGRETYIRELAAARSVVEAMPTMKEAHAMCVLRGARSVWWDSRLPTMTARSYAYAGEALAFLRGRWDGRLRDVAPQSAVFRGGRMTRIPCTSPHGVDLYSQRDVFMIRPLPQRVTRPRMVDELLLPPKGGLLLASVGQVGPGMLFGQAELAEYFPADAVITEVILRIIPRPTFRAPLYAFLTTRLGQSLVRSTAFGTSIPGIRQDLLLDLPIPPIARDDAAMIEASLASATKARLTASAAESEAIRIVEEEVLPVWLD